MTLTSLTSVAVVMNYTLYLPPGVEDAVRRAMSRTAGRNTANVERGLWIVSEIAKRGQLDWLVQNGFTITSYDRLTRGCPRNQIASILKALINADIIQRDDSYLPAKFDPNGVGKSYGYRLTPRFHGAKLLRVRGHSLAVADTLARSFKRDVEERQRNPFGPPYEELDRMAKLIHLPPGPDEFDVADDQMQPMNRYSVVDKFGHRFHESHQIVPRRFRDRLRIGSATEPPLVLDIGASQPLILSRQVLEEARRQRQKGGGEGRRDGSREREEGGAGGGTGEKRGHIEYPDFDGLQNDVREIQRLCVEGDLYSALILNLESLTPVSEDDPYRYAVDRDRAKTAFMIFCMSRADVILNSKAGKAVRNRWPHFWAAVYCIARENEPKHIARMLQRKESELVLLGASARILTQRPDLTFGTVHDAIICDEQHVRLVRGCIEDAYHRGIGVVPRVRIEEYGKKS